MIRISGLRANAPVTLTVRSRDATGAAWASSQRLVTDGSGVAVAGAGAVYRMASPQHPDAFYIWSGHGPMTFFASARQLGRMRASTSFRRTLGERRAAPTTVPAQGFFGSYSAPLTSSRRPAVLVLGGSEGGLSTGFVAASLAGSGYPALALAYFAEPGLPEGLHRIPLEYFARALRWLAVQPQVDPKRIFVLGISRGSEAAQLLGVHYPTLVHGVVAVVPSDDVNCALPGCFDTSWTFHGQPFRAAVPPNSVDPRARIPDELIRGPLLFVCAGADERWPSCSYARDAMRHLTHDRYVHRLVVAPNSGHGVGTLVPYEPNPISSDPNDASVPNELGRRLVWPKLLAFLSAQ